MEPRREVTLDDRMLGLSVDSPMPKELLNTAETWLRISAAPRLQEGGDVEA